MAKPIYTFKHPVTGSRYFQIWDTYYELPYTIPMSLLTLLQYWDINDKAKYSTLFKVYPRLIKNGTTLAGAFGDFTVNMENWTLDYVDEIIEIPSREEQEVNAELENLFASEDCYQDFYQKYSQLIRELNPHPKRPKNYYLSWSRTMQCFELASAHDKSVLENALHASGTTEFFSFSDFPKFDVRRLSEKDELPHYRDSMVAMYLYLAENNFIALDAIPHHIRSDSKMRQLFIDFGMDAYLPDFRIDYDVQGKDSHTWVIVDGISYMRQFVNTLTFDLAEAELIGLRLLEVGIDELKDKLWSTCYVDATNMVNLKSSSGTNILPAKYTSYFELNSFDRLFMLAPFGRQAYEVFDDSGLLLYNLGYYDFHFVGKNIGYFQIEENLEWVRWERNGNMIETHPVVGDDFDEIEMSYKEKGKKPMNRADRKERSVVEIILRNQDQLDKRFLLLAPSSLTEQDTRNLVSQQLQALNLNDVGIDDVVKVGRELVKILSLNTQSTWLELAGLVCLNIISSSEKIRTSFKRTCNYDYLDEDTLNQQTLDRPVDVVYGISCFSEQGNRLHMEKAIYFGAKSTADQFELDCGIFIKEHPVRLEVDFDEYVNRFSDFLSSKDYLKINECSIIIDGESLNEVPKDDVSIDDSPEVQGEDTEDHGLPF